jgi:hypothetical protein
MNGKQAAQAVADHCRTQRHQVSSVNPAEPVLCEHCRGVMAHLEKVGAEERPPLSTASVHFVVDPATGRVGAKMDDVEAAEAAQAVKGVVVSWPVSADYREEKADASPARDD